MSKHFSVGCILCLALSACGKAAGVPHAATAASAPAVVLAQAPVPGATIAVASEASRPSASWLGAQAESEYLFSRSREHEAGVWIEAPREQRRVHVPIALSLSIDTSGSMEGEKIENARRAARSLIEKLHDGDIVSIETFADNVTLRAAPTRLDAQSRARLLSLVSELSADGGTNLFAGVQSAELRASQAPDTHPVRRVVVISDGQATVGVTSATDIGALAERGKPRGVQVTALGVGLDYDERALNLLAERSSGRLFHIGNVEQLAGIMETEIALLEGTAATQAFVEFVPAPGVRLLGVQGGTAQPGARGSLIVPIGTLHAGQRRELLVRFEAAPQGEAAQALLSARLNFNDSSRGGLERVQEQLVSARFTDDEALAARTGHSRVQEIVLRHEAADIAITAARQASAGDMLAADKELEKAEQKLKVGLANAKGDERERLSRDVARVADARSKARAAAAAPAATKPKAARAGSLELNDLSMDMAGY